MTLPIELDAVEASIQANEAKIRALAEYVRSQKGDLYGAFPITHIGQLPGGIDSEVLADNLAASYPNESLSLADLTGLGLDPNNDFTKAAATGFQYQSPSGIGFFITWEVEVGGVVYTRTVDYSGSQFERGWAEKVTEELLLP